MHSPLTGIIMELYSADLFENFYTRFELSPLADRTRDTQWSIDRIPVNRIYGILFSDINIYLLDSCVNTVLIYIK